MAGFRLNMECGVHPVIGYINIDSHEENKPELVRPPDILEWVKDGEADEIRCSAYEDIDAPTRLKALKEWHRCLASGGKVVLKNVPAPNMTLGRIIEELELSGFVVGSMRAGYFITVEARKP